MSDIRNSELEHKLHSEIIHFKRLPTMLGRVEVVFLWLFALDEARTAYDIFLHLEKEKSPMAYNNVHKRVKRLEKLVLIEESGRGRRKAIRYKLTSRGLFEILLLQSFYYEGSIWEHQRKNIILQTLLYQFFEVSTIKELSKIQYPYGRMLFSQYLKTCCEMLINSIEFKSVRPDPLYPPPFLLTDIEIQVKKLAHEIISLSPPQYPCQIFPVETLRKDAKFTSLLRRVKEEFDEAYRNFNS